MGFLHPFMDQIRFSSLHSHYHKLSSSADDILYLHHSTKARELSFEESLLLQRASHTYIRSRLELRRRADIHERSQRLLGLGAYQLIQIKILPKTFPRIS